MTQLALRDFSIALFKDEYGQTRIQAKKKDLKKIEIIVKTSTSPPIVEKWFAEKPFYPWVMKDFHEKIEGDNIFYCFVSLPVLLELPKLFIVPSKEVATYVQWQHQHWLSTRKNPNNYTDMRRFRLDEDDPKRYYENWDLLECVL